VARLFWGRIPVENAYSLYRYQKGSRFQSLIHDLKYRDRKDIGIEFGRLMGVEIKRSPFSTAELILPVPLHESKQRKRGYNQCDPICKGLSESLEIPYRSDQLDRPEDSGTQTDKSRLERWRNVDGIFRVINPGKLRNKHILLADDVVTTGATLEACASAVLSVEGTRVSIATLAVAPKSF
jgi:ComF family protein